MLLQSNLKRIIAFILIISLIGITIHINTSYTWAATDIPQELLEETVRTYSIDDSIVPYNLYIQDFEQVYPETDIVVSAIDFTRYEENGVAVSPKIYNDFEGMDGSAVYTEDNALIEFDVEIKESGFFIRITCIC